MKQIFKISIFLFISLNSFSQSKIEKMKNFALKEGFLLYESEKASWHGSDIFFEKYNDKSKVGGYISYTDGENPKCVFISKENSNLVLGTITFDKTFDLDKAQADITEREITPLEKEYFNLRLKAIERINNDTIFKFYKNVNFNIVPLVSEKEKKVYVFSASRENGKVIFGNDYLINFDKKGNVKKTSRLHKGMLIFEYGDKEKKTVAPMHSHLPEYSEIMTPTDICTTMLYQKLGEWESNYVISKDYVSIWNCEKNELVVLTYEAWKKISEKE